MGLDVSDGEDIAFTDLDQNGGDDRDEEAAWSNWVDINAQCWICESVFIHREKYMSSLLSH